MTRMTRPDCAVMCNLINIHTYIHTYIHHIGSRTVRSETTLSLRQDPHALAVLAEATSDDLQQHLAGVRYQRDAPVVAALCPILLFKEYHDDDILPLLRHLAHASNTNDVIEQSQAQGGIIVEGDLKYYNFKHYCHT